MVKVYDNKTGKLIYDGPRCGAPGFKDISREERERLAERIVQEARIFLMGDEIRQFEKNDPSLKGKFINIHEYQKVGRGKLH